MTRRQIDASRERRLWITQVVMPVVMMTCAIPEARQAVVDKTRQIKEAVKKKIGGKPEGGS